MLLLVTSCNSLAGWRTIQSRRLAAMMRGSKISSRLNARSGDWPWQRARAGSGTFSASSPFWDQKGYSLESLSPDHVDTYLKHLGQTWSRVSLNSTAHALRTWFRYCEKMGRIPAGLADSILAPGSTDTRDSPWDRHGSRSKAS